MASTDLTELSPEREAAVQRLVWWWGLSKVAVSVLVGVTVVVLAYINYSGKGEFPLTRGNAMAVIFVGIALWWNISHMRDSEKRETEDVLRGDHGWTLKKALPRILRWMDEREAK